jgi:hypothetical protein
MPSLTMLAHERAALEKGPLAGIEKRCVPTSLVARPKTPAEGEGGQGEGLHGPPSTPGEGEAGRRGEKASGGDVDHPGCWGPYVLRLFLPQLRGVQGAQVVPGCDPSLPKERSAHHGG